MSRSCITQHQWFINQSKITLTWLRLPVQISAFQLYRTSWSCQNLCNLFLNVSTVSAQTTALAEPVSLSEASTWWVIWQVCSYTYSYYCASSMWQSVYRDSIRKTKLHTEYSYGHHKNSGPAIYTVSVSTAIMLFLPAYTYNCINV